MNLGVHSSSFFNLYAERNRIRVFQKEYLLKQSSSNFFCVCVNRTQLGLLYMMQDFDSIALRQGQSSAFLTSLMGGGGGGGCHAAVLRSILGIPRFYIGWPQNMFCKCLWMFMGRAYLEIPVIFSMVCYPQFEVCLFCIIVLQSEFVK